MFKTIGLFIYLFFGCFNQSSTKKELKKKSEKNQANEELNKKYLQSWQILERMVNQNIFDDIAQGEVE